jgi:hypothetical protein
MRFQRIVTSCKIVRWSLLLSAAPENRIISIAEVHRMHHDAASSLPGTVEKIIKPTIQGEAERVQIAIQSGDDLNQKIRIANILVDARGEAVSLKRGAAVQVVIRPKPKDPIE